MLYCSNGNSAVGKWGTERHKLTVYIQVAFVCYVTLHFASRNSMRPKNTEFSSNQILSESNGKVSLIFQSCISNNFARQFQQRSSLFPSLFSQIFRRPHSNSGPPRLEEAKEENAITIANPVADRFINDIISSTPELGQFHGYVDAR